MSVVFAFSRILVGYRLRIKIEEVRGRLLFHASRNSASETLRDNTDVRSTSGRANPDVSSSSGRSLRNTVADIHPLLHFIGLSRSEI